MPACIVLAVIASGAIVCVVGGPPVEAREYSAYSDPQKSAVSFLLSGEEGAEEFRREFGLSEEKMQKVRSAVRRENAALAEVYAESQRLVRANEALSDSGIERKIRASDYDEEVGAAISATKAAVVGLLPEGSEPEFAAWVNRAWSREAARVSVQDTAFGLRASSDGHTCTVWTTYYRPNPDTRPYQVSLPHQNVKFAGDRRVRITTGRGTRAWAPVKETGPWNVRDNYWQPPRYRDMWDDLPRCVPEAQAAYFNNYNRGRDDQGREVLNPAGFDITLPVARELKVAKKIQREGRIRVHVYYPWAR